MIGLCTETGATSNFCNASYYHLPPDTSKTIRERLDEVSRLVRIALTESELSVVLVFCSRGLLARVACAAYLVKVERLSLIDALRRCDVRPKAGSLAALIAFEAEARGGEISDLSSIGLEASSWENDDGTVNAVLHGQLMLLSRVCKDPQLVRVHNFLSPCEARRLVSIAAPQLSRSMTATTQSIAHEDDARDEQRFREEEASLVEGEERASIKHSLPVEKEAASEDETMDRFAEQSRADSTASRHRTSRSCNLGGGARDDDTATTPEVRELLQRAAFLTGLSVMHAESVQV